MKIHLQKWISGAMVSLFVISGITACATDNKPPSGAANPAPQKVSYRQTVPQTATDTNQRRSIQANSKHLVDIANKVPHVRGASAVALGKYAIVAIDVDPTLDRARVGTIKQTVSEALKEDPKGANALVTADVDLMQRIRNLNKDISQGRPISGIMNELAAIAARIAPQPTRGVKDRERNQTRTDQHQMNK